MLQEFKKFAMRGSVVDLAIGVIIGAAFSKIIDSRTVLIRHANWCPINGRRGQIEDNVRAVDVSPDNDWSAVRVWYGPSQALGTTHWPLAGFIYPSKPARNEQLAARTAPVRPNQPAVARATARPKQGPKGELTARDGDPIAAIIKRELAI